METSPAPVDAAGGVRSRLAVKKKVPLAGYISVESSRVEDSHNTIEASP